MNFKGTDKLAAVNTKHTFVTVFKFGKEVFVGW